MKLNWDEKFKSFDGIDILDENKAAWTLKRISTESLMGMSEHNKNLSGEAKYKQFSIAKKIHEKPDSDFSVDELKTVKDCIGPSFAPIIVGQAFDLLDQKEASE